MTSMHGKIAIVTGGTQGLGAAIAKLFAERGAKGIVTCGRDQTKGRAKADEIARATGAAVVFVRADLTRVEDCAKVVAEADNTFGRVDALVNAAGDTSRGTIIDTSPELFDKIFAVNTRAPFFLMQDTIRLMRRDKVQGTIVNISSMSAMGGQSFIAAYCASKGALDTLTRNAAAQPHPCERSHYWLDGLGRRAQHAGGVAWPVCELARASRRAAAFRPIARSYRGRARRCVPVVR